MPDISKITLPSGNTYDLKDAVARQAISGGVSFIIAWNGVDEPVVEDIPAGVTVRYNDTDYVGTLAANSAQVGAFYLVKTATATSGGLDIYDEYVPVGATGSKSWEKIGDTQADLSDLVTNVTLNKSTDIVLGEATTFALSSGAVTHGTLSGHTTAVVTGYASPTTDTFVKSVSAETNKNLVTTTVPNVTSAGAASTWSFTMGTGANSETLIIGGTNGTAPTLGADITVATGATSTSGTGDAVVTGVTIGSSGSAITGLGTASTTDAVTSMPTSTVGTGITVGTNDKVTGLTNSTTITVTKGA